MSRSLRARLRAAAEPDRAAVLQGFFRTGRETTARGMSSSACAYPRCGPFAANARGTSLADIRSLLTSRIHEERLLALLLLVDAFDRADGRVARKSIAST